MTNFLFETTVHMPSTQQFSEFTFMAITATRNVSKGDEILSNYGREYDFNLDGNSIV